ncbi:MAG TPA: hypothetical protein VK821_17580 [Dehalococcoidia bacterium]|nr:hypothetical protein [Dehalococcoidia bacterium]
MTNRHTRSTDQRPAVCPACGGPPLHPGNCIDHDGNVLPTYEALARTWEEQGRPQMGTAELVDTDELIDDWGDDERPA